MKNGLFLRYLCCLLFKDEIHENQTHNSRD